MKLVSSSCSEPELRTQSVQTARMDHEENWRKTEEAGLATCTTVRGKILQFKSLMNFVLFQHGSCTVFLIACLAYANTLQGAFLHDDNPAILRNPDVQGKTNLFELFKNDFWGTSMLSNTSHKSYRPLCVLTFRFEHRVFGFNPVLFHLNNVLLHANVAVQFFLLCRKFIFKAGTRENICEKDTRPVLCGVLFAFHPIHVEAVAGIVGRAELLSALFYLASLNSYLEFATYNTNKLQGDEGSIIFDYEGRGKGRCLIISLLFVLFSMLCKETGITALGIIGGIEMFKLYSNFIRGRNKEKHFSCKSLLPFFIILSWGIILLSIRFSIMGWRQPVFAKPDNPASQSSKLRTRLLTYAYLWFVNFKLLLLPGQMLYDWSYGTIPLIVLWNDLRNISTLFIVVLALLVSFCILYDNLLSLNLSPALLGLLMLILPFLPSSNLFFPVGFVVAERVLYIPSMGFVILLVILYKNLRYHLPIVKSFVDISLLIIVIYYALNTVGRNQVWYSKETLFRSGLQAAPNNAKIRYNWANFLRDSARYSEAAREYEATLELYPMYAGALNNLATILEMNPHTWSRAEELYIRLIRIEPGRSDAYRNLAGLLMKQKRYDRAVDVYSRLLDNHGSSVEHVINLADLFLRHNKLSQAERLYARVITHHCDVQKDTQLMQLIYRLTFSDAMVPAKTDNCLKSEKHMQAVFAKYHKILLDTNRTEEYEIFSNRYILLTQ